MLNHGSLSFVVIELFSDSRVGLSADICVDAAVCKSNICGLQRSIREAAALLHSRQTGERLMLRFFLICDC